MEPAFMSDAADDLAPIFAVTCPKHLHAAMAALLPALVDVGELSGKFAGSNFDLESYLPSAASTYTGAPIVLSGRSEPVLVIRTVLEALGYTVRVTGVVA